jgi:hypothetical protein
LYYYNDNTVVTLTATPDSGSVFTGWSGACTGTGPCSVSMTAARSVTATFMTQTYGLTVTKDGTGAGTVTSTPGAINCGSTCTATYDIDTVVTLTATPDTRSTFTGWSGACTGTGPCTVDMTAARSVGATFALRPASIGIYRNGTWYLDTNGNGVWDAATDGAIVWGGVPGDTPVVGTW